MILDTAEDARRVLAAVRVVAVLGAHDERARPAFYVPDYLHAQGYEILPVNPTLVGRSLWGEPVRATIAELARPVDVVDVFRPSAAVSDHVADILAVAPPPRVVWLQLGIRNAEAAGRLAEAGIDVIEDRCMLADHRRFGLPPVEAPGDRR